ncbi:Adenylate cyclase type 10 [Phlyctochytrium bullatum]|nr:Adenylate cyclase type 10 [Phlyctochytrium bullatum]
MSAFIAGNVNRTFEENRRGRDEIWRFPVGERNTTFPRVKFAAINSLYLFTLYDPSLCDKDTVQRLLDGATSYRTFNIDCGLPDLDIALTVCDKIRDCNGVLDRNSTYSWRKVDQATRYYVRSDYRQPPAPNRTIEYDYFYAAYFRTESLFRQIDLENPFILGEERGKFIASQIYGGLAVNRSEQEFSINSLNERSSDTTLSIETALTVGAFLLYFLLIKSIYGQVWVRKPKQELREEGLEQDEFALTDLQGTRNGQVADGLPGYSTAAASTVRDESAIADSNSVQLLGKHSTEAISEAVGEYIGKIAGIVLEYNGDIVKFLGDAILVTFSLPEGADTKETKESVLERAIRCCSDVLLTCAFHDVDVGRWVDAARRDADVNALTEEDPSNSIAWSVLRGSKANASGSKGSFPSGGEPGSANGSSGGVAVAGGVAISRKPSTRSVRTTYARVEGKPPPQPPASAGLTRRATGVRTRRTSMSGASTVGVVIGKSVSVEEEATPENGGLMPSASQTSQLGPPGVLQTESSDQSLRTADEDDEEPEPIAPMIKGKRGSFVQFQQPVSKAGSSQSITVYDDKRLGGFETHERRKSFASAISFKAEERTRLTLHVAITAGMVTHVIVGTQGLRLDYFVSASCFKDLKVLLDGTRPGQLGISEAVLHIIPRNVVKEFSAPNSPVAVFEGAGIKALHESVFGSHRRVASAKPGPRLPPIIAGRNDSILGKSEPEPSNPTTDHSHFVRIFINESVVFRLSALAAGSGQAYRRVSAIAISRALEFKSEYRTLSVMFVKPKPGLVLAGSRAMSMLSVSKMSSVSSFGEGVVGLTSVDVIQGLMQKLLVSLKAYGGVFQQCAEDDKGQTLLSVFGLPPYAHEKCPVQAVKASLSFFASLNLTPEQASCISVSVATGPVLFGTLGTERRREAGLLGDVFNLAARLLALDLGNVGADGGSTMGLGQGESLVVIDNETAMAARREFEIVKSLGKVKLKGKLEEVEIWGVPVTEETLMDCNKSTESRSILDSIDFTEPFSQLPVPGNAIQNGRPSNAGMLPSTDGDGDGDTFPAMSISNLMVGYQLEWNTLETGISAWQNQTVRKFTAVVEAESGMGKSNLLNRVTEMASIRKIDYCGLLATPSIGSREIGGSRSMLSAGRKQIDNNSSNVASLLLTYAESPDDAYLISEVVFSKRGNGGSGSAGGSALGYRPTVGRKGSFQGSFQPVANKAASSFLSIGKPSTDSSGNVDSDGRKSILKAVVVKLLMDLMKDQPSVLLIDDAQKLAKTPTDEGHLVNKMQVDERIKLKGAQREDVQRLFVVIIGKTGGNFLKLDTTVSFLVEHPNKLEAIEKKLMETNDIPDSNNALDAMLSTDSMIMARFDRLDPFFQTLLRHASIIGQYFELADVAFLLGEETPEMEQTLEAAIQQSDIFGFLVVEEPVFVNSNPNPTPRLAPARPTNSVITTDDEVSNMQNFASGRERERSRMASIGPVASLGNNQRSESTQGDRPQRGGGFGAIEEGDGASHQQPEPPARPKSYFFKHIVIRNAIYDSIALAERQRLHLMVAERLESTLSKTGESRKVVMPVMSYHYWRSSNVRKMLSISVELGRLFVLENLYLEASITLSQVIDYLDEKGRMGPPETQPSSPQGISRRLSRKVSSAYGSAPLLSPELEAFALAHLVWSSVNTTPADKVKAYALRSLQLAGNPWPADDRHATRRTAIILLKIAVNWVRGHGGLRDIPSNKPENWHHTVGLSLGTLSIIASYFQDSMTPAEKMLSFVWLIHHVGLRAGSAAPEFFQVLVYFCTSVAKTPGGVWLARHIVKRLKRIRRNCPEGGKVEANFHIYAHLLTGIGERPREALEAAQTATAFWTRRRLELERFKCFGYFFWAGFFLGKRVCPCLVGISLGEAVSGWGGSSGLESAVVLAGQSMRKDPLFALQVLVALQMDAFVWADAEALGRWIEMVGVVASPALPAGTRFYFGHVTGLDTLLAVLLNVLCEGYAAEISEQQRRRQSVATHGMLSPHHALMRRRSSRPGAADHETLAEEGSRDNGLDDNGGPSGAATTYDTPPLHERLAAATCAFAKELETVPMDQNFVGLFGAVFCLVVGVTELLDSPKRRALTIASIIAGNQLMLAVPSETTLAQQQQHQKPRKSSSLWAGVGGGMTAGVGRRRSSTFQSVSRRGSTFGASRRKSSAFGSVGPGAEPTPFALQIPVVEKLPLDVLTALGTSLQALEAPFRKIHRLLLITEIGYHLVQVLRALCLAALAEQLPPSPLSTASKKPGRVAPTPEKPSNLPATRESALAQFRLLCRQSGGWLSELLTRGTPRLRPAEFSLNGSHAFVGAVCKVALSRLGEACRKEEEQGPVEGKEGKEGDKGGGSQGGGAGGNGARGLRRLADMMEVHAREASLVFSASGSWVLSRWAEAGLVG